MNWNKTAYRFIFFSSLIWCLSILAAPIANHWYATTLAETMYRFFSRICHQLDSHSLHLFGAKFAVCARCTAIYFGFFLSVAAYPLLCRNTRASRVTEGSTHSRRILLLSILPLLLDVLLPLIGVYESTLLTRIITGMIFGVALPFVLLPAAEEAFKELHLKLSLSLRRTIRHAE